MIDQNNHGNVITIIDAVIAKRKNVLKHAVNNINKQFAFLDLIKVSNLYFYYVMFESSEISEKLEEDQFQYLNGINIYFDYMFCDFTNTKYAPTFLTDNIRKINSRIMFCGEIGELARIKDYYKYHLIEYIGQSKKHLQFRLANKYIGLENLEVLEKTANEVRIFEAQNFKRNDIAQNRNAVIEQMRTFVYPWKQHFIGYDTNEIIDTYYYKIAELYAERVFHFECFEGNAEFGGISYNIYRKCALFIISFALKHIDYSLLLLQKCNHIKLVNVLTINRDIDEMIDVFCSACKISFDDAKQVLDCFTLTYDKYDYHRKNMDYLIMPYVTVSKTQVIFSIVGVLSGIYAFLSSELARKFPKDWSKNINERENQFRKDIFKLFDDKLYIKIDRNMPLQHNGKILTDIDACIIEKATNQIVFFQMKWQEQYGHNLGRRQSRMRNFLNETNKWINDMTAWLSMVDKRKLASMLGLKEKQIDVGNIKLFIVGKYSVYFSGNEKLDNRAEWALWLQLQRLYNEDCTIFRSLKLLFERLQEDSPYNKLPKQKGQVLHTEELDIEIYPYNYEYSGSGKVLGVERLDD